MLVSCFTSHFMSLSTTGLILLNMILTFLHHLMKRRVIGSVLLTTKVTVSPGGSSLRILKRSSFVLAFEVPSELQQTSILHQLQGRGPHFLFPFLILNVENPNTRLFLISCSQGILSSSSFSCYLLLRLFVYMYLSQLMRTFTNYLKCIVISS